MNKLTSRKFWFAVAAFLGSVAASIAGLAAVEPMLTTVGVACGVLSAAIYCACEAYVDGQSASANGTSRSEVITATSNSNAVVQNVLSTPEQQ